MEDLLTALGLLLVLEGLSLALFPRLIERLVEALSEIKPETRRVIGLIAMGLGVVVVWLVRG